METCVYGKVLEIDRIRGARLDKYKKRNYLPTGWGRKDAKERTLINAGPFQFIEESLQIGHRSAVDHETIPAVGVGLPDDHV